MPQYVAFLRGISNVPMAPFREAMEKELGYANVESFGMSGNLLFDAPRTPISTLEHHISTRFGTDVFVRTSVELAKIVANDPLASTIIFLAKPPSLTRREAFEQLDFEGRRPVLRGSTVYFRYPARLRDKKPPFDFEEFLGVRGTSRSSRVAKSISEMLVDRGTSGARSHE